MAAEFEITRKNPASSGSTSKPLTARSSPPVRATTPRQAPKKGIESVKTNAFAAEVADLTERAPADN